MAGLYIHIPFCKQRCIYCDFYSTTLGSNVRGQFVEALCHEITMRSNYLSRELLSTIYIGGGTPSQLTLSELERIFHTIYSTYRIDDNAEITIELNPDDVSLPYLAALRSLPINRLSLGVQTFCEESLKILRRRHTAKQALDALLLSYEAGFTNISIDLMYGLPGQSFAAWKADISTALSLPIVHLSAYALIYEENTDLWKLREQHRLEEIEDDLSLKMFDALIDETAKAGFEHYEVSNFSLPGKPSRHNSSYWDGTPYLGCGPSAHSYDGKSRQWNDSDLHRYIAAKGDVIAADLFQKENLSQASRYNDLVITSLRTSKGLDLMLLRANFGETFVSYALQLAQPYISAGKLEYDSAKKTLRITRSGLFVSDDIMSSLLWIDEEL